MSNHNNDNHLKKNRKLLCNGSFIGQRTKCQCNKNRQQRNHNSCYNLQNNLLKLLQNYCNIASPTATPNILEALFPNRVMDGAINPIIINGTQNTIT